MKKFYILFSLIINILALGVMPVRSQVINAADPVVNYDANNPPATPAWDSIGKWVRTPHLGSWTDNYKAYYYRGMAFRIMFPKSWGQDSTKVYPMVIFLHGKGEYGTIYDNEWSLKWEGQNFVNAENSGKFDGFVLFPQDIGGYWSDYYYTRINDVIDYLTKNLKVDPNRILLSGLSAGGTADWEYLTSYPKYFAGAEIISASYTALYNYIDNPLKYIPIWLSQGGKDGNPAPYTSDHIVAAFQAVGADITYTVYPDYGHGIWDLHYAESDTYPWFNRKNKVNPVVFFGKTEFCPNDTNNVNITLGLTPGFDGYEWRKNGIVISGANSNTLEVHSLGVYDAKIKRGDQWSYWSPSPVVIGVKPATQTPDIRTEKLMSSVIPSPDGSTSVKLMLPAGYATYQWRLQGSSTVLSSNQTFTASTAGSYVARVTETGGCSSNDSKPFSIFNANGINPPDPATNPTGFALSQTQIKLSWSDNPNPVHNETAFEIYRSLSPGTGYQLIGINPADSLSFTDDSLYANTNYYYIVRAIDSTASAVNSPEVKVTTQVDDEPPTPPNLSVMGTTRSSVSLAWTPSTDNASISKYLVYVNGLKSYVTTDTVFTVNNLTAGQLYSFYIKAVDPTGNISTASNQVTAPAILKGLNYSYYTYTDDLSKLPDFNTLTPVSTGIASNVNISSATQGDYFAFKWTGYISIPATGDYTFYTNSDDGSRMYINTPYSYNAVPLVDNDGLHGTAKQSGTIHLSAGVYPFTATYFEKTGGQVMEVYWQSSALNNNNASTLIPDSAFHDQFISPGNPPAAPSHIKADAVSYKEIDLTWQDNSSDEKGFELYRSTLLTGPYSIIATVGSNLTSYIDSSCSPRTTYYYKIQAINQYGSSGFNPSDIGGITYSYYTYTDNWSKLPDYDQLTPLKTGAASNIDISSATQGDNFSFKWIGNITIPIAGTYTFSTSSDDGSRLYVNMPYSYSAIPTVDNDGLHSNTLKSGSVTLDAGTYPLVATYFEKGGDQIMQVYWQSTALNNNNARTLIPDSAFVNSNMSATTLAAPPIPPIPSDLTIEAVSPYEVRLSWNDTSTYVSEYSIYRSVGDSSSFKFLRDIPSSSSTSMTISDSSLFANTGYFYKVQAKNVVDSTSGFSKTVSTTTLNTIPNIEDIGNQSVRYGTSLDVDIVASDPDNEKLSLTVDNLPAGFASFQDYGDGTGLLTFSPEADNQGTYENIKVTATDQHGGSSSQSFSIVVNDNYPPIIAEFAPVNMDANTHRVDTLIASDQNGGDQLLWNVSGLPSFASFNQISNDTALIVFEPGYADAGNYGMDVKVSDVAGASDIKTLALNVAFVNPVKSWYLNFSRYTLATSPWNNLTSVSTSNLIDDQGNKTGVGISLQTSWWAGNNLGAVTGNNSGVYPDNVIKDYYYFGYGGAPLTVSAKVTGLDTAKTYNFTFFASSTWTSVTDNGHTIYSIGGQSVSLHVQNNNKDTVNINNVKPDADGSVTFKMEKASDAYVGYINALVIRSVYDDKMPPLSPTDLRASSHEPKGVELDWTLPQFNTAKSIEVYRSTSISGPFDLLNPNSSNGDSVQFIDSSALGNTTYFYSIRTINQYGSAAFSDTVSILTSVRNPTISGIHDLKLSYGRSDTVLVTASSDSLDVITLTASSLPPFISFTDLGNGEGRFVMTPKAGDIGQYPGITLTASTAAGGFSTKVFNLEVYNGSLNVIQINFSMTGSTSTGVWNLMGGWAYANTTISNLHDNDDQATSIGIKLLDGWTGSNNKGYNTYTNSGIVPDDVISTYYFQGTNDSRRIQISGLSPSAKYNFKFIASSIYSSGMTIPNYTTIYSIGNTSDTLNGYRNKDQYAQINGIVPDANGTIVISVRKPASSGDALLNAMIIEESPDSSALLIPTNLRASIASSNGVNLTWDDHAFNEEGYAVYRANSLDGVYNILGTVSPNSVEFVDSSVSSNTRYFYKIQATGPDSEVSDFSNIASITTPASAVYINFNNTETPAPSPWNNTQTQPVDGGTFANLLDQNGTASGITLTFVKSFEAENGGGIITGNNSGVFPDLVLKSEYYLTDGLDTVVLKASGLDLAKKYDFTFLSDAGPNWGYDNYTVFLINDKEVALNWVNNTKETATIEGISPDENGEITIRIINIRGVSDFAVLNAMVIRSHNIYDDNGNIESNTDLIMRLNKQDKIDFSNKINGNVLTQDELGTVEVYPNPFHNNLNVSFKTASVDGEIYIQLYDVNGRRVYQKNTGNLLPGAHRVSLLLPDGILSDQVYILKLVAAKSHRTAIFKLVRH